MSRDLPVLVASLSARALAASAQRSGHRVCVLDCFGDADTLGHAEVGATVPGSATGFAPGPLLHAAEKVCPPDCCAGLVYGSGFEEDPGLLACLSGGRRLWGNTAEIVAAAKDPECLFPILRRLGIHYPETRLQRPVSPYGWLSKRRGGCGGTHVAWMGAEADDTYYQRHAAGRLCSVLFLASGTEAAVVGFNEQWAGHPGSTSPFVYRGAVSRPALGRALRGRIAAAAQALTRAFGLRGLNGIDFIVAGSEFNLIEINPRPTATLDLWDQELEPGLFHWHLRACDGVLPGALPDHEHGPSRGHAVVYALRRVTVPAGFPWPLWCRDIPPAGRAVEKGMPLCTVHGTSREAATLQARLDLLEKVLWNLLEERSGSSSADPWNLRAAGGARS